MSEKHFLLQVRELARLENWLSYHTYRSTKSEPGFPDLVLVRPPRVIFAELKTENGVLTWSQEVWLDRLARCEGGLETYMWRPSDWDQIVEQLKRSTGRARAEHG